MRNRSNRILAPCLIVVMIFVWVSFQEGKIQRRMGRFRAQNFFWTVQLVRWIEEVTAVTTVSKSRIKRMLGLAGKKDDAKKDDKKRRSCSYTGMVKLIIGQKGAKVCIHTDTNDQIVSILSTASLLTSSHPHPSFLR